VFQIMQIWFFFNPGVGGDGVANLFERSNNVVSFDATTNDPIDYWRVHRFVDSSPKFYAPIPDVNGCFRACQYFNQSSNKLNPGYVQCVLTSQNCIVTSHDVQLQALNNSDCRDIFCKNQIKVLLTLDNDNKAKINASTKNLLPVLSKSVYPKVDFSMFDIVLDVDRIQTNWQYVKKISQDIGFELNYQTYFEYQDILRGNKTFLTNNFQIEEYTSCIQNNNITYKLVDI